MALNRLFPSIAIASMSGTEAQVTLHKCGIASMPGECEKDLAFLHEQASQNHLEDIVSCMGYGGPNDPCTLNINNDADYGMSKDPSACKGGVLFLWDEPFTQEEFHPEWANPDFAVEQWKQYAKKWSSQLKTARDGGLKVTTPMYTQMDPAHPAKLSGQHDVLDDMAHFFEKCPECDQKGSDEYIDILAWNAWIGDWGNQEEQKQWIKDYSAKMKAAHGSRPVVLGNFGFLSHTSTPETQVQFIQDSGMYDKDSGIDSVYYFAAKDAGNVIPDGTNVLTAQAGTSTIGLELLKKCSGAVDPSDSTTPAPVDPTSAPLDPTSAPVDPTSSPVDPTSTTATPGPDGSCCGDEPLECCGTAEGCCPAGAAEPMWCCNPVDPTTSAPVDPTSAPVDPTSAPVDPTSAPVDPTSAPVDPTSAPVDPTSAPVDPTSAPDDPTSAPVDPTSAPVDPTSAPVDPTSAPVDPTQEPTSAPVDPTTESPTIAPVDPTQEPTVAPVDPTTPEPTSEPVDPTPEPTIPPETPTTQEPSTAPVDPTTQAPTIAPVDPTQEPTIAPEDPTTVAPVDPTTQEPTITTTTGPVGPTPSPERCQTCLTMCAPCQACTEGPDGSFAFGSCEKCWHCWDWDDDELEDDDDDMDKECDAMHKDHDWDDEEVRCLTDDNQDCRACWAQMSVFV